MGDRRNLDVTCCACMRPGDHPFVGRGRYCPGCLAAWNNPATPERDRLVYQYAPLVWKLALRCRLKPSFAGYGGAADAFQAGMIGLANAIDRADGREGNKFITFAYKYILGTIQNHLNRYGLLVRVPPSVVRDAKPARTSINRWYAARANCGRALAIGLIPTDDHGDAMVPGRDYSPEYGADEIEKLRKLLDILSDVQRFIVDCRFGLCGVEPMTRVEIGKLLRVSSERVRQIESAAVSILRGEMDAEAA